MTTALSGDELLKKAHRIGQYYGFTPFSALMSSMRGARRSTRAPTLPSAYLGSLDATGLAVASFLSHGRNAGVFPPAQPLFVWHTNLAPGRAVPKRTSIQFHAVGTDRVLAEAVIIRALLAFTRDLFRSEPLLRVNSMGDRETRARYARELGVFFRRHTADLSEECVAAAKTDAFAAAELAIARECAEHLPAPTEYLSDASRKRFEDLLEYLEATGTPYKLARELMSRGNAWNDTCFEILVGDRRVAWGSRYNELAKQALGQPVTALGAVFSVETDGHTLSAPPAPRTRFVFVHIGDEAKRASLALAEDFKRAHVPLTQDIGIESLTEQMRLAEKRNPAYLLIMGRKEALEGVVILRDRRTQEEQALPVASLVERLKAVA